MGNLKNLVTKEESERRPVDLMNQKELQAELTSIRDSKKTTDIIRRKLVEQRLNMIKAGITQPNKKGGRIKYQYGGMADMSAAPMVKQQRQRKRSASSGFRAKYAKGGGVRASKYKL